ncbi:MAG: PLP-dependent lyase/thiolase, partial [Ruegeria sp.]
MVRAIANPHRGGGKLAQAAPFPSVDVSRVAALLAQCPSAGETPLADVSDIAPVAGFWVKDERGRMNLGSFKALGAAYVIACDAVDAAGDTPGSTALAG